MQLEGLDAHLSNKQINGVVLSYLFLELLLTANCDVGSVGLEN